MALSTNIINNTLLNQYASQIKNNNTISDDSTKDFENEKKAQELAFKTMLIQMMDSSGNSMMAELMSTALSKENSFDFDDSLSSMSNFNANMRGAALSLNNYSQSTDNKLSGFGSTSAKYESNGNPGSISNTPGDYGGKSYGAWQFSSKTGSLNSFVNSLQKKDNQIYSKLSEAKAKDGNRFGTNFDTAWTSIALSDKDNFLKLQQGCVKENYYDTAAQALKSKYGFDISKKSNALKESLYSTVVQHGVGGTLSVFSKLNLNKSDGNIINDLYNERQKVDVYFRSSSSEIKQSVYNRFTNEKQDMLKMLNGENV
ncbi:vgrg protein [Clostridium bowmanii]|uniref:VgrG-related protein n=1 Tax=Clostridium bowmanii TaxID=132925 RepID=UPI001C0E34F3|nr:vgrg protein [Clostridium bowmanii]MBU3190515.1 vgrg protein [Clostridium bowmanii]MCA1074423.1 vgrg protein [Clostridium bowmanii]